MQRTHIKSFLATGIAHSDDVQTRLDHQTNEWFRDNPKIEVVERHLSVATTLLLDKPSGLHQTVVTVYLMYVYRTTE